MTKPNRIATTVTDADLEALTELAEAEESSVALILRRAARRELDEHRRSSQRLVNGRTRSDQASSSRKRNRGRVAAAA
jgi:hypothetical protein